jgi:hypothetical protein
MFYYFLIIDLTIQINPFFFILKLLWWRMPNNGDSFFAVDGLKLKSKKLILIAFLRNTLFMLDATEPTNPSERKFRIHFYIMYWYFMLLGGFYLEESSFITFL